MAPIPPAASPAPANPLPLAPVSSDSPIRVGLIGYGLAGAVFHAPLFAAVPGMRLAMAVTRDPERARRAEADHPGVQVVDSADRLWERADELDLVVVASPNRTHVPLARAALQAGLPVVVDKPLAASAAEGRELVEEAQRLGLLLAVFQNRRWDGDFMTLQKLIDEGALGEVFRFESRFERWRVEPKPGWRQSADPQDAGGLLFDLGAHLIDQARLLFGPVRQVYAELDQRRSTSQVDDDTFVALTHHSGVRSHLWMGITSAQNGPRFRVLGSQAAYVRWGMDSQEAALQAGRRPDEPGWGEEPESAWGILGVGEEARPVRSLPGDYTAFYRGVAEALRTGSAGPMDPMEAVAVLEIVEAAVRSAERGEVVGM